MRLPVQNHNRQRGLSPQFLIPYSGFSVIGDCTIPNSRRRNNSAYLPGDRKDEPLKAVQLLPRILHAEITQPRHVRYLARDALTRTLEK